MNVESALNDYRTALKALEVDSPPEKVLDVLIARDRVHLAVRENPQIHCPTLLTISELDQSFKELIAQRGELKDIAAWRDVLHPPQEAWWWFLETPPTPQLHLWMRFDWLWEALTVVMVIVNFSLVTAIATRFLKGGLDPFGAFAVITQSLVAALAAGGALTTTGRKVIERGLETLKIPQHFRHEVELGIGVLVFSGLLILNASLPCIADYYVQRGITQQEEYQFTSALDNYRRATELDPNNLKAYYLLGNSYEQLQQLDQARSAYQVAVLGNVPEAFNNLARLYIVKDKNYSAASALLIQALQQNQDDDMSYFLLKNLGWARLGQKRYAEAQAHLEEAIHLNEQQGSAHCLLAQVLEAQEQKDLALKSWENCQNYASGQNPDEDEWFGLAQQRLNSVNLSGN